MIDWKPALEVFFSGIIGVFVVMFLLQVSTQLSSAVIRYFEKSGEATENVATK